jgi:hypothetical protein
VTRSSLRRRRASRPGPGQAREARRDRVGDAGGGRVPLGARVEQQPEELRPHAAACRYVTQSACRYVTQAACRYVTQSACRYVTQAACRYVTQSACRYVTEWLSSMSCTADHSMGACTTIHWLSCIHEHGHIGALEQLLTADHSMGAGPRYGHGSWWRRMRIRGQRGMDARCLSLGQCGHAAQASIWCTSSTSCTSVGCTHGHCGHAAQASI